MVIKKSQNQKGRMRTNKCPSESTSRLDKIDKEENIIYEILHQLDGLEIALAHDTLNKIHLILSFAKNPIDITKIRESWFPEIEEEHKHNAMKYLKIDGHDHTCIAHTNQIYIYHRTSLWYSKLCANQCLYYMLTKDGSKCHRKLTKTNLLNDYRITRFEDPLVNFLKNNSVYKRNPITKELEILRILK